MKHKLLFLCEDPILFIYWIQQCYSNFKIFPELNINKNRYLDIFKDFGFDLIPPHPDILQG